LWEVVQIRGEVAERVVGREGGCVWRWKEVVRRGRRRMVFMRDIVLGVG